MVIKYHISPYPALTEDMIVRVWEAESDGPAGWIYEEVLPEKDLAGVPTVGAGHQVPNTITINGLDKVVHIVRLYSAVSAALLHEYNVEPLTDTLTVYDPIRFTIGDGGIQTPLAGDDDYKNGLLNGLGDNDYKVYRNNYGVLFPGIHYNNSVDPLNGGFTLAAGDTFNDYEEFTVEIRPTVNSPANNDSVVGKLFGGFVDVLADTSYIPAHLRKLIRLDASVEYTFGASDSIPVGYIFVFQHFGNNDGIATVRFNNGNLIWGGAGVAFFDIPRFSEAAFTFDGVNWNVVYTSSSVPDATAIPIVGRGKLTLGDIAAGDPVFTITHGLNIVGDYCVFLSIQSFTGATKIYDNDCTAIYYHDANAALKKDLFYICVQELYPGAQNIIINWMIVKM